MNNKFYKKKRFYLAISLLIIIISFFVRNNLRVKKTIQDSHQKSSEHKDIREEQNNDSKDKKLNEKITEDHKHPERKHKKRRIQTKREIEFQKVLNTRNPHINASRIEITHDLKEKVIAIIFKGEITYTAEIDKHTGKIIKTWGRTQFEYRKDLQKLNFKLPTQ